VPPRITSGKDWTRDAAARKIRHVPGVEKASTARGWLGCCPRVAKCAGPAESNDQEAVMAEVFVEFSDVLPGANGVSYQARACGAPRADGLWEGWIEFVPVDGSETLRSARETTQPNERDTAYWASGLTFAYLEGSLDRTLSPLVPPPVVEEPEPAYDRPAPSPHARAAGAATTAVLDPYHVYAEGRDVLLGQLNALSDDQLRNIIRVHGIRSPEGAAPETLRKEALVALILAEAETRVGG
jgi:hypothetical protein